MFKKKRMERSDNFLLKVACLTSGIYYPGKEKKTQSTNIFQFNNFPAICLNYSVLDSGDRYCIHSLLSFLMFIKQSIKMLWGLDAYHITITYLEHQRPVLHVTPTFLDWFSAVHHKIIAKIVFKNNHMTKMLKRFHSMKNNFAEFPISNYHFHTDLLILY